MAWLNGTKHSALQTTFSQVSPDEAGYNSRGIHKPGNTFLDLFNAAQQLADKASPAQRAEAKKEYEKEMAEYARKLQQHVEKGHKTEPPACKSTAPARPTGGAEKRLTFEGSKKS